MGLLPQLGELGYVVREVRAVNRRGKRIAGFSADVFEWATQGRYLSIPRGDLAAVLFNSLEGRVETIFGDTVDRIEQGDDAVDVTLQSGAARRFDLVIGADGLHSQVRRVVFGPDERFEKYLGYQVAAFEVQGYRPRDELVYVSYTEVGQQVARFSLRNDRTMFLFIFTDGDPQGASVHGIDEQKALLRRRFGNSGWECPAILDALDSAGEIYFDRVSQIRMGPQQESWSRGRVCLIGDAAFCVSFLAGQGAALAMIAGYLLAGELHRAGGDHRAAFARYQERFGPFAADKQRAAIRFASAFAPRSRLGLFLRNQVVRMMNFRPIANFAIGRDLTDRIELPEY